MFLEMTIHEWIQFVSLIPATAWLWWMFVILGDPVNDRRWLPWRLLAFPIFLPIFAFIVVWWADGYWLYLRALNILMEVIY